MRAMHQEPVPGRLPGLRTCSKVLSLALACGCALAGPAAAAEAEFGPESLWDWQFVGDARISPDGKRIVYVRTVIDRERDDYDTDLWMQETGGDARALTGGAADDRTPRWSPDGRTLAFLSNRSGKRQVHILDFRGGEPWQLTADPEGVQSYSWAPNGRHIAFTSRTALPGEAGYEAADATAKPAPRARAAVVTERLFYRNDGSPGYRGVKRAHTWVVDVDKGPKQGARRVTRGNFDDGEPIWSADSTRLYFDSIRRDDGDYSANDSEIYVVPADGSTEPRALTSRVGPDEDPLPSPDGRWIAFTGYDATSPPQSAYVSELHVMRTDGTQLRRLALDFDRDVPDSMMGDVASPRGGGSRIAWSPDSRRILFTSTDRGQAHLFAVEVASGDFEPLTRFRQGDLREFTLSREGRVAAVFSSSARPAEVYSFPLAAAGRHDNWTQVSHHTAASAAGFSEYEELWFDSFDGQRIQGWIIKPRGFDPSRRYPLILYIHGGPHAMYGSGFFHEFQVLAQAGYVVLITNPRGSTGYGERFANIIQYKYPGDDFRDLMTAVDQVLGRGYVDETRMGVAGGSGGGLLTSWTVGHTDRFRAAIVERAVINWHNFVGTADLNYFFATHWFRDFPWRDSADYLARSPISYVDNVKTPVMVIHSEEDYRTPIDQGLQFYAALKMLKKPARLVVFPESSHGLSREGPPSQRVERLKLIRQWFDENLGAAPMAVDGRPQREKSPAPTAPQP
jgi:dipeptidyl aminopeptidase/acylaminoacyl peptidase